MNGYIAIYGGKRVEVYAESLFAAKEKAIAMLRPPKNKRHMVAVMLAEKNGQPVTHSPAIL